MAQEEAWSHFQRKCGDSQDMYQCLNHQEFTQCCYSQNAPLQSPLLLIATF